MAENAGAIARKLHVTVVTDHLVRETPFGKLSVEDICRASGVPHSTFYKLFPDKFGIALWYQRIIYYLGVGQIGVHYSWKGGCFVSTSGVELLRPLVRSASQVRGYESTCSVGVEERAEGMLRVLRDVKHAHVDARLRYMVEYCARAEISAAADWIMRDDLPENETWSEWLAACVPAELRRLLDTPEEPWDPRPLDLGTIARVAASL